MNVENNFPRKPEVVVVNEAEERSAENLRRLLRPAAAVIRNGGVVAYPTETVYGLGVDVSRESAISSIFTLKGRGERQPILILIPSSEDLYRYVEKVPETALALAEAFWPGGLTLVCEAKEAVSNALTAGTGKIGVRFSDNSIATELCRSVGGAITSTSANRSGSPPCTSAAQVLEAFPDGLALVVDGGSCTAREGSTVVDVTETPCRVLREGVISREALGRVVQIR